MKTNAIKTLDPKTTLVINIDGKTFPLAIPHKNYSTFPSIEGFLYGWDEDGTHVNGIVETMENFKSSYGNYPKTVVVDTVSRVFGIIADNCNRQFKGFDVHSNIAKQIADFNQFLQVQLVEAGINVVTATHVTYDEKTSSYIDAASGSYKRSGGAIAVHDNVVFFQAKGKKYQVTHKEAGLPCRSLLPDDVLPAKQPADEYSLADHIDLLTNTNIEVSKFTLD